MSLIGPIGPMMCGAMDRRDFLTLTSLGAAVALARPLDLLAQSSPIPLEELTIAAMQEGMRTGRFTARSLAEAYLARIAATDEQTVNAMIELNPDALAIADALDRERRAGRVRGPMHGIPIVIKDN